MTHVLGTGLYLGILVARAVIAVASTVALAALEALDWAAGETHWRLMR